MSTSVTKKNTNKQNISLVRKEDIEMLALQKKIRYTLLKRFVPS